MAVSLKDRGAAVSAWGRVAAVGLVALGVCLIQVSDVRAEVPVAHAESGIYAGEAHSAYPLDGSAGPGHLWRQGTCADILLRPVNCTVGGEDHDSDGGAVWVVSFAGPWKQGADASLETCAEWGSVAYTVGGGRLTCWDLTGAVRGEP